ncbi:uncharacterized protein LY89DRAFT_135317 [Mollisia scopiformis]|uniref:Uncharacterized protein n=1 Tax=Mollisia scopiformis TaxID=149040 RepID=A0A194X2R0_MOLSC|nr:uncharacterized protein LY89DRAFT_135317 [Mollisia scopiformis]KUJ14309.1 hypothetical protein LY89DRAFT_135317 [Mollisia scopiformis]
MLAPEYSLNVAPTMCYNSRGLVEWSTSGIYSKSAIAAPRGTFLGAFAPSSAEDPPCRLPLHGVGKSALCERKDLITHQQGTSCIDWK